MLCKHRAHPRPGPPPHCHLLCPWEVLPVPPPHPWAASQLPQDSTALSFSAPMESPLGPQCLNQPQVLLWLSFAGSEPTSLTEINSDNDLFPSSDPCPHEVSISKSSRECLCSKPPPQQLSECFLAAELGSFPRLLLVPARAAGSWTSRCSQTLFPPGFRSHPSWWLWPGQSQLCPAATCG